MNSKEAYMHAVRGQISRRSKVVLSGALLAALTGCLGYVDGGYSGDYGGAVIVPEPDVVVFGGGYERGRDVHEFSHRGAVSRGREHDRSR